MGSRSICVFCGSAPGTRPEFADAARIVGAEIGRRGWTLVYGGGRVGLMGILADAALQSGARVLGVIPRFLYEKEVGHDGLTSLEIVATFAERKQRMGELSDAFLSLPGGVGTMDEMFEAWSWTLARLQDKPNALLNTAGYYDDLIAFLDRAVTDGLLRPTGRDLLKVAADPATLLDELSGGPVGKSPRD
jgi:uncharacterized protein (TIGR00730 family)